MKHLVSKAAIVAVGGSVAAPIAAGAAGTTIPGVACSNTRLAIYLDGDVVRSVADLSGCQASLAGQSIMLRTTYGVTGVKENPGSFVAAPFGYAAKVEDSVGWSLLNPYRATVFIGGVEKASIAK